MKKKCWDLKKIINYTAVLTIFTEGLVFQSKTLFDTKISYFILCIILVLLLTFFRRFIFNKLFFYFFCVLIIFSLYNIFMGNDTPISLFKQSVGIFINAFFFYLLVKFNEKNIKELFSIYLFFAFWVGLIAIIQEGAYLMKIRFLYDFSYILPNWRLTVSSFSGLFRANSVMPEPSLFCLVMMPAFFTALISFFGNRFIFFTRFQAGIVIVSVLFSFSSLSYMGIFLSIILLTRNYLKPRYILAGVLLIFLIAAFFYDHISEFRTRVNDTVCVLTGDKKIEASNLTTFTFVTNTLVTIRVLKDNFIIGHGLGSHEISYNKYFKSIIKDMQPNQLLLNKKDANSLLLRLLSETGVFGLWVFLWFIAAHYIPKKMDKEGIFWIVNNSILVLFILRLLRQGHYFSEGFFFFFWLYYFTKKIREEHGVSAGTDE